LALINCDFFAESLGLCTSMTVILPQPTRGQIGLAGAAGTGPHPVLWLLHGMSDDHTIWLRRTSIERYVSALGLAVVMPAAGRSFYVDQHVGLKWGTFVGEELPELCRAFFPLSAAREDNFVAGLSMGGYGAFKLALDHPERYAAAASLSGALDIARVDDIGRDTPEWDWMLGPAADRPGGPNDLLALAGQVAPDDCAKLWQWCGTEDFLYRQNQSFKARAESLGLPLTYTESPGGHSWDHWDQQIQNVLAWLPLRPAAA